MPYDFMTNVDFRWSFNHALNQWPINPQARVSGSDILSNLILYIPLGYLLASILSRQFNKKRLPSMITIIFCTLTSLSVETAQAFTFSRTASFSDLLMNSISGTIGCLIAARYGWSTWNALCDDIYRRWSTSPLDIFTALLAVLIAADSLSPFLPTVLLSQVWRSFKHSHFELIAALALHPWHWWLVNHALSFMVLTILALNWNHPRVKHGQALQTALLCALFALCLETGKLFIVSRSMNTGNVIIDWVGVVFAVLLVKHWNWQLCRQTKLELGLVTLLIYLLYQAWYPFNFQWDLALFMKKVPSKVQLLPFYHYAMGASLNHVRLFLQTVTLSGVFIYFFRLRFPWFEATRFRLTLALLLAILLGGLQEGGQLFIPSRTPSMTDVYCYMLGGFIAVYLPRVPETIRDHRAHLESPRTH